MNDVAWLILVAICVGLFAVLMNRPPPPGGKPRGRGAAPPTVFVGALLLAALAGCANPLNSARLVVGGAADFYNAAEPRLEAQEKADLDACLLPAVEPAKRPACVEGVIASWGPTKTALVALEGAIAAARLGLLIAASSDATGKPVDAAEVQRLVLAVIEAVTALQRTAAPRPSPAPLAAPSAIAAPVGGSSP